MALDDKDKHTMCMRGMRTDLRFCVDATCTELTQSLMQAGGDMGHQNEYTLLYGELERYIHDSNSICAMENYGMGVTTGSMLNINLRIQACVDIHLALDPAHASYASLSFV
jgi:hypothetical protein